MVFNNYRNLKIHFIGIGGIGMSGIAEVLISMGFKVSGSDVVNSSNTMKLSDMGAQIYIGHEEKNVEEVDLVVYSSAIIQTNPEVVKAKELKLPLMRRAEMLAELMRLKQGIAVGGTHGKTTTTSILATILKESSYDPTYIIGGIVNNLNGHANVGSGNFLVAEADESDGSFLLLNPVHSIITNIDNDHLDHYGSEEGLLSAFDEFANKIPFYGACALNAHEPKLVSIHREMKKPSIAFGIDGEKFYIEPDVVAKNVKYTLKRTEFEVWCDGELFTKVKINIPGRHNVLNSLGAIAIARQLGVSGEDIAIGASKFVGVGRRFQTLFERGNFTLIDDYAHHPTEIQATLETLRQTSPERKIIALFEPHRFTRTRDCWDGFLHCFNAASKVYVGPVYPASEDPIIGIDSNRLVLDINQLHPRLAEDFIGIKHIGEVIEKYIDSDAIVITLGAGSIGREVREWLKKNH